MDSYATILVPQVIASKSVILPLRRARLILDSNAKCIMILWVRLIPSTIGGPAFHHSAVAMAV